MIRLYRIHQYRDKLRSYKIIIDDEYISDIQSGETLDLEIPEGKHTIYLKIDWCRSNKINFYKSNNENIEFDCGNSMDGWRIFISLLYVSFFKDKYLRLKMRDRIAL